MLSTNETVMIGDRTQDLEATKCAGVNFIRVDYGYGDKLDREIANSDYICDS